MRFRCTLIMFALVALVGCPNGKPKGDLPPLHPVKGKVVRGSLPVSGGSIRFVAEPESPDLMITSDIRSDGTFELQTIHALSQKSGAGAPAGTYKVTYTPPLGDQTAGGVITIVELTQRSIVKEGPNDLTVEVGKK